MPPRVLSRRTGTLAVLVSLFAPTAVAGQGGARSDSVAVPGIRMPFSMVPRITWTLPAAFRPFGRMFLRGVPSGEIAAAEATAVRQRITQAQRELWLASVRRARDAGPRGQTLASARPLFDSLPRPPADTGRALFGTLLGERSDLGVTALARFEAKLARSRNERCTASQTFVIGSQCAAGFQPLFDFQMEARAGGTVADRLHLNVDYDTKREFEASNNIHIFYTGKSDEIVDTLEVGNVSLNLPASQFITNGIPKGNYGLQAIGQVGAFKFRTIFAQQKGDIPKTLEVMVGDHTVKSATAELEDYQAAIRRFFFTVDPQVFGAAYPNIDLLNGVQLRALADGLPPTVRPRHLSVYRLSIGGQPKNPNGPRFQIIGDPNSRPGQVYDLLQEGVEYYADPSLLWIALARPLNLQNERLVVAYTLRIGGRDTVIAETGGTPDLSYVAERPQFANLLWDPQTRPADPAFRREIRSFYQVAGEDLRRQSVTVRIVTGGGVGQEKPLAGLQDTYLQMFGLSQSGNPANFDTENRLWPRLGDQNISAGAGNRKIISDYYLVFPSVRPFARNGLVTGGNPASDTIYVTPNEDLYSQQHPQSNYRIQLKYDIESGSNVGGLSIGAVQLRKSSEVVLLDNILLVRDRDYTIDYDLGQITFTRPDTLFPRPRQVSVRYEENPQLAAAPTNIFGFNTQIPFERGELGFTAISQSRSTSFTRPPLGYEPQSALIAGLNGHFSFEAAPLSRWLEMLPTIESTSLSRVDVQAEVATSRPQQNSAGQAHVESFEGEGGITVPLAEAAWYYSSQPAMGNRLAQRLGAETFSLLRASTMAWQNGGLNNAGFSVGFTLSDIDPQVVLTGTGVTAPEQLLWLTLYPLATGGLLNDATRAFQWTVDDAPTGRRWRSVRAGLGPSGADLSRVEYIEFWTLADTSLLRRATNPTLIIDLGDASENSVVFGPTDLRVTPSNSGVSDSVYKGKVFIGFDRMDSERDSLSQSFNQAINDKGLAGDVVPLLQILGPGGSDLLSNFATCSRGAFRQLLLGDARTNCTVGNGRLDEEDVDLDHVLNLTEVQRESERLRRYIIDLSNPSTYSRVGKCNIGAFDTTGGGTVTATNTCWVHIRVPFGAPDDSLNGGPNVRRVHTIRMTVVSGEGAPDSGFAQIPFAKLTFSGSPTVKRSDRTVHGIAGDAPSHGYVVASVIGTQDRDTLRNLDYVSPPGVSDQAERQQTGLETIQAQINERSLRLQAGQLDVYDRAESFIRFPEGAKTFMNYREMRVWARGRGNGWGEQGELQFYVKIGRDANNFYLYRTPVNAGNGQAAWLPEVRVDFDKLIALRGQIANSVIQGGADSISCSGIDSILIARSGIPFGQPVNRHAACADGYIAYSIDPAVNPPDLAQVQELAVGMVRVANGGGQSPITFSDTLELWVDDIRLARVQNTPGYAAQASINILAGDVGNFRANFTRRDAQFRQIGEQPSFLANDGFDIGTSLRLERLVPGFAAYSLPLVISHTSGGSQPLFLSNSDVLGAGIDKLRTPRSEATRYSLNIRRVSPVSGSAWGVLVNNLSGNASMSHAKSRSEFSDGGSSIWNLGLDYDVRPNARYRLIPSWMRPKETSDPRIRWNPTYFRFSSDLGRIDDERLSYLKPAVVAGDSGRRVRGLTFVWRTSGTFELRPLPWASAGLNYNSMRDLREYGDTSAAAIVATHERQKFAGIDVGLERERQVNANVSITPAVTAWFHPSLTLTSSYSMQRDPQSRQLVRKGDSTGAFVLPRRLSNIQTISAGSQFDPGRALRAWFGQEGRIAKASNVLQAFDVVYSRTLNSAFDGAPFTPGLGYQFALGGLEDFRTTQHRSATYAGAADQLLLRTGLQLPYRISIEGRLLQANTQNFTRRLDNTQAEIQGKQQTFPDISLAWTFTPPPGNRFFASLGLNADMRYTSQLTYSPAESPDQPGDRRSTRNKEHRLRWPVSWADGGHTVTSFGYTVTHRVDSLPGSFTQTSSADMNADIARIFRLPPSWGFAGLLRTRAAWQHGNSASYVTVAGSTERSRLSDFGRTNISLNADTDLAPNVRFSLLGSRVISFDNNYNRKFSQYVLSLSFTLSYFAGEPR